MGKQDYWVKALLAGFLACAVTVFFLIAGPTGAGSKAEPGGVLTPRGRGGPGAHPALDEPTATPTPGIPPGTPATAIPESLPQVFIPAGPRTYAQSPPFAVSYYVSYLSMLDDMGYEVNVEARGDALVILAFGDPDYSNGDWGAKLPNSRIFVSTADIASAVQTFLTNYMNVSAECAPSSTHPPIAAHLTLGLGTNNVGTYVQTDHAVAWAGMVNDVSTWVGNQGLADNVFVAGASDMELGWNDPETTKDWVYAYCDVTPVRLSILYNFGDAEGCPYATPVPSTTPVNEECAVSPPTTPAWTQADVYEISWGAECARAVPQIYNTLGHQAQQWALISRYGKSFGDWERIWFDGALTQYQACVDQEHPVECDGTDNKPSAGWRQLWFATYKDPDARVRYSPWSTDIRWDLGTYP